MPSRQKGNRPGTANSKRTSAGATVDAEHGRPSGKRAKRQASFAVIRSWPGLPIALVVGYAVSAMTPCTAIRVTDASG